MAANHIKLDVSKQKGSQLFSAISQLAASCDQLERLKAIFWEMRDVGQPGDYHLIAFELGITDAEAETFYAMLDQTGAALASSTVQTFLNRLG